MTDRNKKSGFHTDIFSGALKINEEMHRTGKISKKPETRNGKFYTDAFKEALRINGEMNKR